ncbi:MAG: DUF2927 domain-containing protein [Saccharofermentanales bacterium]|jgi:uncharacterized protein YgiM (DUF1202 family)
MLKRKNNVIKIFIWILLISLAFTNISSLNVAAETMETIETAETAESIETTDNTETEDTTELSESSEPAETSESSESAETSESAEPVVTTDSTAEITETSAAVDIFAETTENEDLTDSPETTPVTEQEIPTEETATKEQESATEESVSEKTTATSEETSSEIAESDATTTPPALSGRSITGGQVTRYIYADSIIRNAPNGSIITTLKMPLFVTGTIRGAWLKFTYNGTTAYVANSVTTTGNPPITGYAKSAVNVRTGPGGSVLGTIPKGRQVQGVLVGNMVRFTYNGRTGYIYVSLLQATPVKVTGYIPANSKLRSAPNGNLITTLKMPLFVSGTIHGAWLRFTYNGRTAYVAMSLITTKNPAITGYAKKIVNVRTGPGGLVLGTIAKGRRIQGVLVGNMVRFTYNGRTGYVYVSLLQGTPVQVTCYIYANTIIRNNPNGNIITKLWRPLHVTGTIQGAWLKFSYNGKTAYVAMSLTTTGNPAMTGYAKQNLYVRNTPSGAVTATLPIGRQVQGVLVGNMVKFTYNGKTAYVYAVLLQKNPVQVTRYIVANSIIRSAPNGSIITKLQNPVRVTGTIQGAWLRFTYKGRTAYVAMSSTTVNQPTSGLLKAEDFTRADILANGPLYNRRHQFDPQFIEDALEYFPEIAGGNEFDPSVPAVLNRWDTTTPIRIGTFGQPTSADFARLNMIIPVIERLTGLDIQYAEAGSTDYNYEFHIAPLADFEEIFQGDYIQNNWGFVVHWHDYYGYNFYARMAVSNDYPGREGMNHLIMEEFIQSLGLPNDSYRYPDSIFQQNWTTTQELMPIDWLLLEFVYRPELTPNMSVYECVEILRSIYLD